MHQTKIGVTFLVLTAERKRRFLEWARKGFVAPFTRCISRVVPAAGLERLSRLEHETSVAMDPDSHRCDDLAVSGRVVGEAHGQALLLADDSLKGKSCQEIQQSAVDATMLPAESALAVPPSHSSVRPTARSPLTGEVVGSSGQSQESLSRIRRDVSVPSVIPDDCTNRSESARPATGTVPDSLRDYRERVAAYVRARMAGQVPNESHMIPVLGTEEPASSMLAPHGQRLQPNERRNGHTMSCTCRDCEQLVIEDARKAGIIQ